MSLEKFWNIIDISIIGKIVERKKKIVASTDPDRIYIENIRSFFNIPFSIAKGLCELAVKENIFRKKVGIVCPNSECERIIKSYDPNSKIDDMIICNTCELKEEEKYEFVSNELEKITYYQLVR